MSQKKTLLNDGDNDDWKWILMGKTNVQFLELDSYAYIVLCFHKVEAYSLI